MSLCYRTCVSVFTCLCYRTCVSVFTCLCVTGPVSVCLHVSVLQDLCQCAYMSLCYRTCVSVFTCLCYRTCVSVFTRLCVTGHVSVCLHVSVLQDLCQCVYMSLCYRTCVSVLEQETCRRHWTGACVETECRTQPISTAHTHQSPSPSGHVYVMLYATGPHTCLDSTLWVSWHCGGIVLDMTAT